MDPVEWHSAIGTISVNALLCKRLIHGTPSYRTSSSKSHCDRPTMIRACSPCWFPPARHSWTHPWTDWFLSAIYMAVTTPVIWKRPLPPSLISRQLRQPMHIRYVQDHWWHPMTPMVLDGVPPVFDDHQPGNLLATTTWRASSLGQNDPPDSQAWWAIFSSVYIFLDVLKKCCN